MADGAQRVKRAKELLATGSSYPMGCSEFVCTVLGISQIDANELMGSNPSSVGSDNVYSGLTPGDIAGWQVTGGHGHVAVYIGETDTKFIDVKDLGESPRAIKNGYGAQKVYKSSRAFV